MSKKWIFAILIAGLMLFVAGCELVSVREVCSCDCCECGHGQNPQYNDGEYEGWAD